MSEPTVVASVTTRRRAAIRHGKISESVAAVGAAELLALDTKSERFAQQQLLFLVRK